MILQSFVLPSECCMDQELYFRAGRHYSAEEMTYPLTVHAGDTISSMTYMNMFDASFWKKHTHIKAVQLLIHISGVGSISLYQSVKGEKKRLCTCSYDSEEKSTYSVPIPDCEGYVYFKLKAKEETTLHSLAFACDDEPPNKTELAVIICTYKREKQLRENIGTLIESCFFNDKSDERYGKMTVTVVDNASELKELCNDDRVELVYNRNTGGSGGFSKGMEILKLRKRKPTHVILMDDDVSFINESFYRLYALFSYMKPEYLCTAFSGRMFRLDRRYVQYTASEIWNGGSLRHVGHNLDMRNERSLDEVNNGNGGEYSGWWFAVYPYEYVEGNRPFNFFLHCDDVEYGLRKKDTPLILNGIQVWHETYEYRQSPVMLYYDARNRLYVNRLTGADINAHREWEQIYEIISQYHVKGDYLSENMYIKGILDYTRGLKWLEKSDGERLHKKLSGKRNKKGLRLANALMWRIAKRKIEKIS